MDFAGDCGRLRGIPLPALPSSSVKSHEHCAVWSLFEHGEGVLGGFASSLLKG